jgi:kynureninase
VSSEDGSLQAAFAARARAADEEDPLSQARERFTLPAGVVYLDGNSLGALPKSVGAGLAELVERQWGQNLITSWNVNDWWTMPARVGDRIGQLIGAAAGQVICGDSTSVQLFQALVGACRLRPGRSTIITDGGGFPTDQYLADSVAQLLRLSVMRIHPSQLADVLSEDVAVVSFSQVD